MKSATPKATWSGVAVSITWFLVIVASVVLAAELVGPHAAVATGLVVLCSCFLIRKTAEPFDPRQLTITSFWYATYLAMIFFPAFFIFADQELHPSRVPYLFSVESALITVPIGALIASKVLSFKYAETGFYFNRPFTHPQIDHALTKRFVLLFGGAILLTGFYVSEVGTIPLFYLVHNPGDYLVASSLREDSFKLLDSHFEYVYFLLRGTIYPLLTVGAYGCYVLTRQRKWKALFFGSLAGSVFFASLSLAKAPVAMIFLVLGLFIYFYQHRKFSMRKVAIFLCLIFVFPIVVILGLEAGKDLGGVDVAQDIGKRLLYGPSEVVYYYFEVFPDHVGYLHGRSIGKLSWLLGENYFDTPNYVGRYGYPQYPDTVNANGAFISDLNADFGLWGVVFGGVVTGVIMQLIHIYLIRRKKTVFGVACYAFMLYGFWDLNSMSLPTVLASSGILFSIVLVWFLDKNIGKVVSVSLLPEYGVHPRIV